MAAAVKEVVVVGAGVIGLTTALKIQERGGYHVTIIAEILPGDDKSIKYTSHWAGAHHVSFARDDARQEKMNRETFDVMWELSAPGSSAEECFLRLHQEEYYREEKHPECLEMMPDFKVITRDNLVLKSATHGISFNTVTIDVPVYLNYLSSRLLAAGGSIIRGSVQHVSQLIDGGHYFTLPRSPVAIVVCAGLGARTLGGVEDRDVFPIRGQTVLLRAPWVRTGITLSSKKANLWTYVIPRRSGDVIVGGSQGINDWYPSPRPETTRDILERSLALCPEIAPPEIRAIGEPTVEDIFPIIIEEGCGLRPGRKGGIRLEIEWAECTDRNGNVPIIYNYGHGGYGYISSWGSASIVLDLLESALGMEDHTGPKL